MRTSSDFVTTLPFGKAKRAHRVRSEPFEVNPLVRDLNFGLQFVRETSSAATCVGEMAASAAVSASSVLAFLH